MSSSYKEKLEHMWGISKVKITARKKGTLIYLENRTNHIEGMVGFRDGVEIDLAEIDYLIFDIPEDLDPSIFDEIRKNNWLGIQVRKFAGWTEVACHHPQVFHNGLLEVLQRKKYISVVRKEYPNEQDGKELPYYVNARGWQIIYNMFNLLRESIRKGRQNISKHPKITDSIEASASE